MRKMLTRLTVLAVAALCFVPNVNAQDAMAPTVETTSLDMGDVRSKSSNWLIPPDGSATLGAGLSFMTAEGALPLTLDTEALKFTDMVFLRLDGRYAVGDVAEVTVDTSLLPKQPSFTDELLWQSSGLGFRLGLAENFATSLRVKGGPTLDREGGWASAILGLDTRFDVDRYIFFDAGLYGQATGVQIDGATPWFIDLVTNFQIVLANPGAAAMWVGVDFAFPLASESPDTLPFNPQTRSSVHLGGAISFVDDWDVYAKYAYVDRGDLVDPSTILPVLDGGFDQQQLTVGLVYRFGDTSP